MLRFDTLKFAKELTDAGMDQRVAEAIVRGLSDADTSELATKADIASLAADIAGLAAATKADIAGLAAATKADIAGLAAATKADIAGLAAATRADIAGLAADAAQLRADVKADMAEQKAELFRFLYLQAATIIGLTVALIKLLPV